MEENPLEDLEARMKRAFRMNFDFLRRLSEEIAYLKKQVKMLEDQITNIYRTGDN